MFDNIRPILEDIADRFLIALNYRFEVLFDGLDSDLWEKSKRNPVVFLRNYNKTEINKKDYNFDISLMLDNYFSLIEDKHDNLQDTIAYFSPEFGFHESFPNYAGGLGILAGDVIKTAATNGMKMIGVGLFYQKGYFRQSINNQNKQTASYRNINLSDLPVLPLKDFNGNDITVEIDITTDIIRAKAYKLRILNSYVILLNTNLSENGIYSDVCDKLYTGDRTERLIQEIVLGIGGARALDLAGIKVDKYHINEGHASFALIERAALLARQTGIDIHSALDRNINKNVFTTHTPVIHGNEEFDLQLLIKYLRNYLNEINLKVKDFISFGQTPSIDTRKFSMTALGINLSEISNGVSRLHGETAAKMWSDLYQTNNKIKPMTYVTNGIHINSWIAPEVKELLENNNVLTENDYNNIEKIDTESIFECKLKVKERMLQHLESLLSRNNNQMMSFMENSKNNYGNCLTIGFARRFAPYKRADLIFNDIERLSEIVTNANRPVRIIFSGKAHPKDSDGKELLTRLLDNIIESGLEENILFIPDYDIRIGRLLVQGCDFWLNTPQKPLEACGTSGMKSALNFGINLSITDGWWNEAFNGKNGFSITDFGCPSTAADTIYTMLQKDIIPLYYSSDASDRIKLAGIMKQSFWTAFSKFSSERMLQQYNSKLYNY